MPHEYKVVAAPRRGAKARGVRAPEARFALALEVEMNRMAAEGWEFVRSDTLPCDERQGWLGGRATVPRSVLVFRRALAEASDPALAALPPTAAHAAPIHAAPARAAFAPMPEDLPFAASAMPAPVPSPPAAPRVSPQAARPVASPPARDAASAPAAAILAAPRRVPVPPLRPRDGADQGQP